MWCRCRHDVYKQPLSMVHPGSSAAWQHCQLMDATQSSPVAAASDAPIPLATSTGEPTIELHAQHIDLLVHPVPPGQLPRRRRSTAITCNTLPTATRACANITPICLLYMCALEARPLIYTALSTRQGPYTQLLPPPPAPPPPQSPPLQGGGRRCRSIKLPVANRHHCHSNDWPPGDAAGRHVRDLQPGTHAGTSCAPIPGRCPSDTRPLASCPAACSPMHVTSAIAWPASLARKPNQLYTQQQSTEKPLLPCAGPRDRSPPRPQGLGRARPLPAGGRHQLQAPLA
jgi:hypothetical protein